MAFWIDRNFCFTFKGKDYGFGDELPAGVPEATLKSFTKKRRTSQKPPVIKAARRLEPGDRGRAEVQDKLDAAEETIGELTQKLSASEKTVAELTEQLTKPKGNTK